MKYLSLGFLLLLISCAAPKYTGPGTFQEFANARYQCVQETSARQSGAYVNQYGGFANSSVMPTCSAFTACLASKGYYESSNGQFDPAAAGIVVRCR
jgi:hypothetical protein